MSTGVGFAGLGRSLAKRTLGLLKRRRYKAEKQLENIEDHHHHDLRLKKTNNTDYTTLVEWAKQKRTERNYGIILMITILLTLVTLVLIFLFHVPIN